MAVAPDGTLYFVAGGFFEGLIANPLIHFDLTQGELGEHSIELNSGIEDIDVVIP